VIDALTEKMNGKTSKHRCVLPEGTLGPPNRAGARFLSEPVTPSKNPPRLPIFFSRFSHHRDYYVTLLTPPSPRRTAHAATSARSRRSHLLTAVSSRRPCTSSPWRRARTTRGAPPSSSSG
jgi:hypothetical protein